MFLSSASETVTQWVSSLCWSQLTHKAWLWQSLLLSELCPATHREAWYGVYSMLKLWCSEGLVKEKSCTKHGWGPGNTWRLKGARLWSTGTLVSTHCSWWTCVSQHQLPAYKTKWEINCLARSCYRWGGRQSRRRRSRRYTLATNLWVAPFGGLLWFCFSWLQA